MTIREKDKIRFFKKIRKTNYCWFFLPAPHKSYYGNFSVPGSDGKRKTVSAHRFSYLIHIGAIKPGLCVCHKCDVPSCVNPDHLFLGTHKENVADSINKGRRIPKNNNGNRKKRTHCKKGHLYSDDNLTFIVSKGLKHQACLACRKIQKRNQYYKNPKKWIKKSQEAYLINREYICARRRKKYALTGK